MNASAAAQHRVIAPLIAKPKSTVLSEIYQKGINMAAWQSALPSNLMHASKSIVDTCPKHQMSLVYTTENITRKIQELLGNTNEVNAFINDAGEGEVDCFQPLTA